MKIFTVTAKSESGDDYGPFLFNKKPTEEQLSEFLIEHCPGDYDEEMATNDPDNYPGNYGYLHVEIYESEVYEL